MAEITYSIDVSIFFTLADYREMKAKIERWGTHHLFFQSDKVVSIRATAIGNRDENLWIGKYVGKTLPPYVLVLKDIDYALSTYQG